MARRVHPLKGAPRNFRITGSLLQRFLNKAADTASGADQWSAAQMCDMPEEALDELATAWNLCMGTGGLPRAWMEVRTVTIPKSEGGYKGAIYSHAKLAGLHERGDVPTGRLGGRVAT